VDRNRPRKLGASAAVAGAVLAFAAPAAASDFAPAVDHDVGGQVYDVAAGDLNRDGRLDVATVEQNMNRASTLLNTGAGALGAADRWATLDRPYALTIADLDRDGRLDLAVANLGSDSVTVHRGKGNGRFEAPKSFATGLAPVDVKAADIDGDGILDLAVLNNGWPSWSVSVLLGRGDGTFDAPLDAPVGQSYPQQLAFGDLDRDGRLDIFVSAASAVAVLRGHGDGRSRRPRCTSRRSSAAGRR
jgi:FG-GAP-like repeat